MGPLTKKYGAQRVYLFGSCARGDMADQSNIDLHTDRGAIRWLAFAGLLGDLEDTLGTHVDLISTAGMDDDFYAGLQSVPPRPKFHTRSFPTREGRRGCRVLYILRTASHGYGESALLTRPANSAALIFPGIGPQKSVWPAGGRPNAPLSPSEGA